MPDPLEQKIDDLAARLRRMEDTLTRLAANVGGLSQGLAGAVQDTLFSQVAYLGDHRALTYLRNGQKIFVDTRSVDIGTHILFGGTWESNYMAAFKRQIHLGDTVLDIGANHGIYALAAGLQVGTKGHVYAFEASRHFSELIRASISINGLDGVVSIINAAVAATAGEAMLNFEPHWSGGAHVGTSSDSGATSSASRSSANTRVSRILPRRAAIEAISKTQQMSRGNFQPSRLKV